MPPDERTEGDDEGGWRPRWGDRAQELAWIGIGMDEPMLRCSLLDFVGDGLPRSVLAGVP